MRVSMDGLRRNATNSMTELCNAIEEMFTDDRYNDISEEHKKSVTNAFNNAGRMVTTFNCLYDDNEKDDFNDMSDVDCKYLEEIEDEE